MGAFVIAIGVLLCGSSAFAAQNVGNTSQKGSLVIFPQIDISPGFDTIIRISNDANTAVDLTCYYINERKGRRDFHIRLTRKQPIWFSVGRHTGTYPVAAFPTNDVLNTAGTVVTRGALLCWATDVALANQISHNHLSGNATVVFGTNQGPAAALVPVGASLTYPSWNFTARDVAAGATVGTPGRLDLTGASGAYDACPNYLIGHFSPALATIATTSGAGTGTGTGVQLFGDPTISVLSCNVDLKQDFTPHFTKLQLSVWNEQEVKFTGSYECSDGVKTVFLATGADVGAENFRADIIQSAAAQVKVKGVASTQCNPPVLPRPTENSGLVGTLWAATSNGGDLNLVGTSMNGAGTQSGFILWDAQDAVVPELR
jgi:hypothetical protein